MSISLFMPYFRPAEAARQEELALCLQKNRENELISHIYLMVDDDAEVSQQDGRVTVIRMDRRPTYQDWTRLTEAYCPQDISILANADICFDETVSRLEDLFAVDPTGFVALSRYELIGEETSLHPNPHWSQDSWAYCAAHASNPDRDRCLNFPLGVPRCDNKVAYIFAVYGHTIYNPCYDIRSIHVHETGLRTYDKKGDMRIVGGMAMVHASDGLADPAKLDIEFWPIRSAQFGSAKINASLERWAKERGTKLPPAQPVQPIGKDNPLAALTRPAIVAVDAPLVAPTRGGDVYVDRNVAAYDAHWQHPAITEQHAFNQVRLLAQRNSDAAYLGFPWATLIDVSKHNQTDTERLSILRDGLERAVDALAGRERIFTVCQHIHMLKFPELFEMAGVTDVFWSHATHGETGFGDDRNIAIHPFPLYPVQIPEGPQIPLEDRRYLFSFVGAKATPIYLTESRTFLIEELAEHPRGLVRDRETWHYNKVVYDHQVLARAHSSVGLVDNNASEEFKQVMAQTQFALCPSGTGPNSIRLWETIASGAIPVVLADTYKSPGSPAIWEQAVIRCAEDRASIRELPERLEAAVADKEALRRRKAALRLLAVRYGRSNFVPDVLKALRTS
ncbi:exostosin family protein [Maricaulis sp. W15]|uniref:exostosin domain-containing protein n=1 Tax=Maricaulis sp. W15 TaxID=1772333 RepID=UPI000B21397C|nr:exostosin family protein [Maricaulis sp. W15]